MTDYITEAYSEFPEYTLYDYLKAITEVITSSSITYIQSSEIMRQLYETEESLKRPVLQSIAKIVKSWPKHADEFLELIINNLKEINVNIRKDILNVVEIYYNNGWKEQATRILKTLEGQEEDKELLEKIKNILEN